MVLELNLQKERDVDKYIVFDAGNIKSIFNRGEFDPTDPRLIDIKKARKANRLKKAH